MKWFCFVVVFILVSCNDFANRGNENVLGGSDRLSSGSSPSLPSVENGVPLDLISLENGFPPSIPISSSGARSLSKNWNLVGFPVMVPTDLQDLFNSGSQYEYIQSVWMWDHSLGESGNWRVFPKASDFELLTQVTPNDGYWIRAYSDFEFVGTGISQNIYNFAEGWNLIGVSPSSQGKSVSDFFATGDFWENTCDSAEAINSVWSWENHTWKIYFPERESLQSFNNQHNTNFEALSDIKAGQGYWVNAKRHNNPPDPSSPCQNEVTPDGLSITGIGFNESSNLLSVNEDGEIKSLNYHQITRDSSDPTFPLFQIYPESFGLNGFSDSDVTVGLSIEKEGSSENLRFIFTNISISKTTNLSITADLNVNVYFAGTDTDGINHSLKTSDFLGVVTGGSNIKINLNVLGNQDIYLFDREASGQYSYQVYIKTILKTGTLNGSTITEYPLNSSALTAGTLSDNQNINSGTAYLLQGKYQVQTNNTNSDGIEITEIHINESDAALDINSSGVIDNNNYHEIIYDGFMPILELPLNTTNLIPSEDRDLNIGLKITSINGEVLLIIANNITLKQNGTLEIKNNSAIYLSGLTSQQTLYESIISENHIITGKNSIKIDPNHLMNQETNITSLTNPGYYSYEIYLETMTPIGKYEGSTLTQYPKDQNHQIAGKDPDYIHITNTYLIKGKYRIR